jgi:hypothetical protein
MQQLIDVTRNTGVGDGDGDGRAMGSHRAIR